MKAVHLGLAVLLLAAPAVALAGDKIVHLSFENGVAAALKAGFIDGSVKFYHAASGTHGDTAANDNITINRKTNTFGK